jgi:HPt (histidine-containing phosphotransfer) domain-containing protein
MSSEARQSSGNRITNLQYLQELSEGNLSFIEEMLTIFINSIPQSVIEMQQALRDRDWKTLNMVSHKIKPNYGFVGLKDCEQMLQRIEKNAGEMPDPVLLTELLEQVSRKTDQCIMELKEELLALGK